MKLRWSDRRAERIDRVPCIRQPPSFETFQVNLGTQTETHDYMDS
jgi:hypothetical protein